MTTSQTSFQITKQSSTSQNTVSKIGERKNIMAMSRKQLQNEERRLDGVMSSYDINCREISKLRARKEDVSEEIQRHFDIDSYSGE